MLQNEFEFKNENEKKKRTFQFKNFLLQIVHDTGPNKQNLKKKLKRKFYLYFFILFLS